MALPGDRDMRQEGGKSKRGRPRESRRRLQRDHEAPDPTHTEEWLAVPPGTGRSSRAKRQPDTGSKPEPRTGLRADSQMDRELAALRARVAEVEARAERAEARAEDAERRAMEATVRERQLKRQLEDALTRVEGGTAAPQPDDHDELSESPANRTMDLNAIDYAGLRELGLSVTESARVLAIRDVRGGFRGPEELDELDALPPNLTAKLKASLEF